MIGDWTSIDSQCHTKVPAATPKYIRNNGQCSRSDGKTITKVSTKTVADQVACEKVCIEDPDFKCTGYQFKTDANNCFTFSEKQELMVGNNVELYDCYV